MRTTPEQRAYLRADVSGPRGRYMLAEDLRDLLDDLDEALAQLRASHEVLADLRAMTTTSQREVALLAEVTALRAVAEAARDAADCDGHAECCNTAILAEQRGKAKGLPDSDVWDDTDCDCAAGRARETLRAALRAWEEREP